GGLGLHDHAWTAEQRACDRDDLSLSTGQRRHRHTQVGDVDRERGQEFPGATFHLDLVQSAGEVELLVTEEEVPDDVEIVAKGEVLVDGGDTQTLCVCGVCDVDRFAVPGDDTTVVGGVCPGAHLDPTS